MGSLGSRRNASLRMAVGGTQPAKQSNQKGSLESQQLQLEGPQTGSHSLACHVLLTRSSRVNEKHPKQGHSITMQQEVSTDQTTMVVSILSNQLLRLPHEGSP
eukprot:TRINITY_DN62755_c0_g1_i1.p4 TRINITY_DN62755_c0_g1~~TRINITY_DN62755_c0_g1_i1.p4  ORF type:complete len:103 (-),score=13.13 TRINITY_DN62755_c0_g1_i1:387-695(-)